MLALVSLAVGVLFVLPVGGADVPIVISLLNAFTGLTVAASRLRAGQHAAARRRHPGRRVRHDPDPADGRGDGPLADLDPVRRVPRARSTAGAAGRRATGRCASGTPDDVAILLGYARKVVIVPGYGLAVAQAQHTVRELAELLEARGVEVIYGIHPVAGRMPGHMNVLLAEANVPYEELKEMDEVNPEFAHHRRRARRRRQRRGQPGGQDHARARRSTACRSSTSTRPQNVIFLKRSMRPGFAGIDNELLYDPKTTLLFGDAKDSLTKVVAAVKAL